MLAIKRVNNARLKLPELIIYLMILFFELLAPILVLVLPYWVATFFFPAVLGIIVLQRGRILLMKNMPMPIVMFFTIITFSLVMHFNDLISEINLVNIFFSLYVLAYIAYLHEFQKCSLESLRLVIKDACKISLIGLFIASTFLTSVNFPGAPDYYPWKAFYTTNRLILVDGHFGITENSYLTTILICLYADEFARRPSVAAFRKVLIITVLIFAEKSRTGDFVLLCAYLYMSLSTIHFNRAFKIFGAVALLVTLTFPFLALNQGFESSLGGFLNSIQSSTGSVIRISNVYSEGGQSSDFSSGRNELNFALLAASAAHPISGSGDADPILKYGVDQNGDIADATDKAASVESPIRLAVKYGWPYFVCVILFVLSPMYLVSRKFPDMRSRYFVYLLVTIFLGEFFGTGGFESFYGDNAITIVLLFIFAGFFKTVNVARK
jgi:hypothetical protein